MKPEWMTGYIEFHIALDNPILNDLTENELVRLDTPNIYGLFEVDFIDRNPRMHKGIECAKIRLKQYSIQQKARLTNVNTPKSRPMPNG